MVLAAPGSGRGSTALTLPDDYYRRLAEIEARHWWARGMRAISQAILGRRFEQRGLKLLDAGCGAGGFLAWAAAHGSFTRLAGVDVSDEALSLARRQVPAAQLEPTGVEELPFEDASFDLVVANDVLQHLTEDRLAAGLRELRRTVAPQGSLLARTNGARRASRPTADWQLFDRTTLQRALEAAGFTCERVTYAGMVPSLWAAARGHFPRPPSPTRHGIPSVPGPVVNAAAYRLLELEARYLAAPSRTLPYGHTLFALALPGDS